MSIRNSHLSRSRFLTYITKGNFPIHALLILSALSNLADRLIYGGVRDWIEIGTVTTNLADIGIIGGVALLSVTRLRRCKTHSLQ